MEKLGVTTEIIKKLAGTRCVLIGFDSVKSNRLAQVLDRAQAFSRALTSDEVSTGAVGLDHFDVVILDARLEPEGCPWLRDKAFDRNKPLLLIGSSESFLSWAPIIQEYASDFLVSPWTPEAACLRIYQLLSSNQRRNKPAPAAAAVVKGPPNILVADDDLTTVVLVKAAIEGNEMTCQVAGDGEEALEMARAQRPDAIILDVNMPVLDGYEVLASLKNDQKTSSIPTILLTSYQQEINVLRGFSLGAADYIVKPFNPIEMVARLKRLLPK
ncbi:MAG TPA: response regulator [Blastocatellia bacterium]|nr:response regulator [Blastocatellia bacterium]